MGQLLAQTGILLSLGLVTSCCRDGSSLPTVMVFLPLSDHRD